MKMWPLDLATADTVNRMNKSLIEIGWGKNSKWRYGNSQYKQFFQYILLWKEGKWEATERDLGSREYHQDLQSMVVFFCLVLCFTFVCLICFPSWKTTWIRIKSRVKRNMEKAKPVW